MNKQNVFVADLKLPGMTAKVKWPGDATWRPLSDFRWKGHTLNPFTPSRTFLGNDGVEYRWKIHGGKLELYYAPKHPSTGPLVRYHRNFYKKEPGYMDILGLSVVGALDTIIVSFLAMENRRRD
ncbi:hypothetical protein CPB86DRAFT_622834 [Serendipita vermifera]|nr:hypothetical protein CPB86DRAFT_622834 [Serendipita vermifera]